MRIAYMGTPEFAVLPLERIYSDGHDVAAVFTQPDKPRNRGMRVSYSPVKEVALAHGTPTYQPSSLRRESIVETLRSLNIELIIVVAYGKLLPKQILSVPPFGCINLHASLLPKYRGAAPIHWAILNGETETGVTTMQMTQELDAGDILHMKTTRIGDEETTAQLHDRLSVLGAVLLSETICALSANKIVGIAQNHEEATYAPPITKSMSPIDWSDTAVNIKRKVRGLNSWPIAETQLRGVAHKVFSVDISESKPLDKKSGDIILSSKNGIEIVCADGSVIIKELQAPGSKRMTAAEYLRGIKHWD